MSADPLDSLFEHRERVHKSGWRKALPWVVGIVVLAGVAALVIALLPSSSGHKNAALTPNVPAKVVSQVPKTVKLDPQAEKVARRFIQTAVARKHLAEAYKLAGPQVVQGQTLKQWMGGNIAVIPFPVNAVSLAPMKVDYSYKNEALIEVALLTKPKSGVKSQLFTMQLNRIDGKWVVNSWVPRSVPFVHSQD
ncbi:MAG TPA: hypothetical protein VLK36_09330 [Gaiellaceae bacterium]|nr:hypothetical protein [Gaiellaceae bacterium]